MHCTLYLIAHLTPYFISLFVSYFILTIFVYIYTLSCFCFIVFIAFMLFFFIIMFYFSFLHFPLSGPVLTNISLPIIPCMIVYVTNNKEPWTYFRKRPEEVCFQTVMSRRMHRWPFYTRPNSKHSSSPVCVPLCLRIASLFTATVRLIISDSVCSTLTPSPSLPVTHYTIAAHLMLYFTLPKESCIVLLLRKHHAWTRSLLELSTEGIQGRFMIDR